VKETTNYLNGQYQALRVKPDLLVWHSRNSWSPIVYLDRGVADGVSAGPGTGAATPRSDVAVGSPAFRPIWPWWGGGSGHFIATSIGAGQPSFASELNVTGTNSWWGFGDSFTANGLLFTSHQASEWDPTLDPPPYVYSCYDASGTKIVNCTNDPPPGMWVTRYYLDVIDFNDAADPLLRKPVNIPGTLLGIDRSGELLFTRGYLLGPQWTISGGEEISASGYDGVEAHLISTLPLTNQWPRPAVVNAGYVYLGNAAAWNDTNATLQIWGLNASGKFELNSEKKLDSPAQTLALTGSLLILQETAANALSLYDPSRPADPRPVGAGRLNTCYGFNLDGADADLVHGLWVPASWYGVAHIPTQSGP
jgi:hypothetical protein